MRSVPEIAFRSRCYAKELNPAAFQYRFQRSWITPWIPPDVRSSEIPMLWFRLLDCGALDRCPAGQRGRLLYLLEQLARLPHQFSNVRALRNSLASVAAMLKREGGEPRPLCYLPDGRGHIARQMFQEILRRGATTATTTSVSVRRSMSYISRQKECVQMPGKMARSDPRPSVRVTRGAGSGQHLASLLQEGRENANIDAGLGYIWGISVLGVSFLIAVPLFGQSIADAPGLIIGNMLATVYMAAGVDRAALGRYRPHGVRSLAGAGLSMASRGLRPAAWR
jgi:hypothetical protein